MPALLRVLLLLTATLAPLTIASPTQAAYGPACSYDTILNGQYTLIPLKNQAMISRERCGYRFRAGQQNSRLVITQMNNGLRFHDSGTREWKSIPDTCRRLPVDRGVAAFCPVPAAISTGNPMLVEIWPRLGDDYIDASTLPAKFQLTALVDAGRDVVKLGAGDDFVNGAFDRDRVSGGGGDDWIRTGPGPDTIQGGAGNDRVVGGEQADVVRGGSGNDSVEGSSGDDQLYTGSGTDRAQCGDGRDTATIVAGARTYACERIFRY